MSELRDIDQWYLNHEEPNLSCFQALREWILRFDQDITEAWKYRMPMFVYKGKMFCYLWSDKRTNQPYIGIVKGKFIEHPLLIQAKRAKMKVLYIDPNDDLPIDLIEEIFETAKQLY